MMAVATLAGSSAFAESRHGNRTQSRDASRGTIRRDAGAAERSARRGDATSNRSATRQRSDARSFGRNDRNRGTTGSGGNNRYETYPDHRNDNARRGDNWRDDGRSSPSYRGGSSYGNRQPYYAHGRVSRISPYRGGYRVWIGGAPYPFFISDAYYRRNRFRIGLTIGLGGFYNPLGYYDYYDGYNGGYYSDRRYSAGSLRGTVESVDNRRDTFVVRNEATGSFVTVAMRDRRRDVRPGDYVELSGDWTRSGIFEAYDVSLLGDGDRDGYRR